MPGKGGRDSNVPVPGSLTVNQTFEAPPNWVSSWTKPRTAAVGFWYGLFVVGVIVNRFRCLPWKRRLRSPEFTQQ